MLANPPQHLGGQIVVNASGGVSLAMRYTGTSRAACEAWWAGVGRHTKVVCADLDPSDNPMVPDDGSVVSPAGEY